MYRSIQVTDIRCEGKSHHETTTSSSYIIVEFFFEDVGFGKRRLWELFSLKRFNSITKSVAPDLQQNQIHDESSFPTESDTMESLQNKDIPTTADSMVDFDFGAAPVG